MSDAVIGRDVGRPFDLLRAPLIGSLLARKSGRRTLQALLLGVSAVMILDGFSGPHLAPRNLATVVGWVHYRGLLILGLLIIGNVFCLACPFTLARDFTRRFIRPRLNWPHWLRGKWPALVLFVAILFAYERFDLWAEPAWTAMLIVAYFVGAVVVDSIFRNAAFCKHVCPIGQFNFLSSTLSPLEVKVRDLDVCRSCKTFDCIRGRRDETEPEIVLQRGCELALFQPRKVGNLDCTFCLDCVYACPHENVGILTRVPGEELGVDERRSGIGRLSRRGDYSVLALVFVFAALLNAFAMVSPVYAVEQWLGGVLGSEGQSAPLAALFVVGLVIEPVLLLGAAALVTRTVVPAERSVWSVVRVFSFGLIPFGVGVWAAHYLFHLLTGLWTWIPAADRFIGDLTGRTFLAPGLMLPGFPEAWIYPLEVGLIALGCLGSALALWNIAEREFGLAGRKAFAPWGVLIAMLGVAALWLLAQPMEMRGTFFGG